MQRQSLFNTATAALLQHHYFLGLASQQQQQRQSFLPAVSSLWVGISPSTIVAFQHRHWYPDARKLSTEESPPAIAVVAAAAAISFKCSHQLRPPTAS
jgi:hypothetical protein